MRTVKYGLVCHIKDAMIPPHRQKGRTRIQIGVEWLTSTWKHMNDWCLRPRFCTVKAILAGDNLGEFDEFCYEPCPWSRTDRSTCWPAVQRATTVSRMPPTWKHNMWPVTPLEKQSLHWLTDGWVGGGERERERDRERERKKEREREREPDGSHATGRDVTWMMWIYIDRQTDKNTQINS